MARARNIKPGLYENEELAACSFPARYLFPALWQLADREGRLEDRPLRIKGYAFRYDSIEVEPLLVELEQRGFICRYRVDGQALIQVVNFAKHQNPHHREPPSVLPAMQSPGLEAVGMGVVPEAMGTCQTGEASDKPKASPGLTPPSDDLARGSSRAESLFSDSGLRIPDSGSPTAERSEAIASGATAPPESPAPKAELWAAGKSLLTQGGMPIAQAGAFIGKLIKDHGETVVHEAVQAAVLAQPKEGPVAYLKACCKANGKGKRRSAHTGFEDIDYTEVI